MPDDPKTTEEFEAELDRRLDAYAEKTKVAVTPDEEESIPSQRTIARFFYQDSLHWIEKVPQADAFLKVVRPVREGDSEEFPVEWNNYVQRQRWVREQRLAAFPKPRGEEGNPDWPMERTKPAEDPKRTAGPEEISDYDLLPDV